MSGKHNVDIKNLNLWSWQSTSKKIDYNGQRCGNKMVVNGFRVHCAVQNGVHTEWTTSQRRFSIICGANSVCGADMAEQRCMRSNNIKQNEKTILQSLVDSHLTFFCNPFAEKPLTVILYAFKIRSKAVQPKPILWIVFLPLWFHFERMCYGF